MLFYLKLQNLSMMLNEDLLYFAITNDVAVNNLVYVYFCTVGNVSLG